MVEKLVHAPMLKTTSYVFKQAESDHEIEQIHRLNHRTFAEELGQHAAVPDGFMIDKFHDKNVYFIAVAGARVVGMISAHDSAPFSVSDRLPDPSILLQPGCHPCEVRLLAVDREHRTGPVVAGLLWSMVEYARGRYTNMYISAITDRVEMYERLGFRPLGPAVRCGQAEFVPMCINFPLDERIQRLVRWWTLRAKAR